jgi:hypothetical protein
MSHTTQGNPPGSILLDHCTEDMAAAPHTERDRRLFISMGAHTGRDRTAGGDVPWGCGCHTAPSHELMNAVENNKST